MRANYHAHTYRCHHASHCEWEYVEKAIEGGLEEFGFADHSPQIYPIAYDSISRMAPEKLAGYIETIEALKRIYHDRILVRCGLEVEYLPELFPDLLRLLEEHPGVEYILLSQHYYRNEYDCPGHVAKATPREKDLAGYVDQAIEGMMTGKFLYMAHPDVINYTGLQWIYKKHMRRLCQAAKAINLPLEINLQGPRYYGTYPRPIFWEIAAEEGCTAILGTDAHAAQFAYDPQEVAQYEQMARELGLNLIDKMEIPKR